MTADASAPRLDRFLAEHAGGLSRSAALRLIRDGRVTLNGAPAQASDHVARGDVIDLELPQARPGRAGAEDIALDVVYEDADLVVVNKAAGMVVHPAAGHDSGTLVNALLGLGGTWSTAGGEERPGIVHRLDKGTSGLIVAARNDAAHRSLASQLADRTLSRTYLAIARGVMRTQAGELEGAIGRHPRERKRMAVVADGRFARTRYEVIERKRTHTLVRCDLDTGRTHQIRVHLAALGHPIAGDTEYGGRKPGEPTRPMLHAWRLRLRHPRTGAAMSFEAPPPADFESYWAALP
ncbi:MAG TPA: RluA family pseudouridine synthase [Candidatus Dormibacteraeota bacterium]|nr:RluA family pseudouridine synthase [Candidatus Dormibacteraeota bacterium]